MSKWPIYILSLLLFSSCDYQEIDVDNLEGPNFTGDFAIPLGEMTYTIRELLDQVEDNELNLSEDSTSLIYMAYYDTVTFSTNTDLIQIPDIVNSAFLTVPALPASGVGFQLDSTYSFEYRPQNNEEIDSIYYSGGIVALDISSTVNAPLTYTITIHNTASRSTNQPIVFSGALQANSNSQSIPLVNHKTFLLFLNNVNTFQATLELTVDNSSPVSAGQIDFTLSYLNQQFERIYGRFGQDTFPLGNQTLNVGFFEELGESGIVFGNPSVTFTIDNSYGVDMGLLLNNMYAVETASSDTTFLGGSITENPVIIAGPSRGNEGEFVTSTVVIDKNNSSIVDLLQSSPDVMGLRFSAQTNPLSAETPNFLLNTSQVNAAIEVLMPLEVQLYDLERTVEFSLGGGLSIPEADSIVLRLVTINELPFSGHMRLELRDEADSILHVAAENLILAIPFLSQTGLVLQPRTNTANIYLNQEGLDAMAIASKLALIVRLNTPEALKNEDIFVKILADYELDVKVSVVASIDSQIR